MKELFVFPAGNLPSFIDVMITVSKFSTLLSNTPMICSPESGSPSKDTSAVSINFLYIS